jgi:hypothetical protein
MSSKRGEKRRTRKNGSKRQPTLRREPPVAVKRALRQEVGFGCPVPGCGNPYLQYHHFDPEWHVEQHHNPARMVALCGEHHDKARAFTPEQCREFKANGAARNRKVQGRFDWMRKEVLGIAGSFFYGNDTILEYNGERLIWFNRDEHEHLLLNIVTPDAKGRKRIALVDNDWFVHGAPFDVESPPNGAYLKIKYRDGDELEIRFREFDSAAALLAKHPGAPVADDGVTGERFSIPSTAYPLTCAEVKAKLQGLSMKMESNRIILPGNNVLENCSFIGNGTAISAWNRPPGI